MRVKEVKVIKQLPQGRKQQNQITSSRRELLRHWEARQLNSKNYQIHTYNFYNLPLQIHSTSKFDIMNSSNTEKRHTLNYYYIEMNYLSALS